MSPPGVLAEREPFAAKLEDAAHAPSLVEARDILDDLAAALAPVVLLLVRIHRGDPFKVEPQARGVVAQTHAEAAQAFKRLDRQRADLDLVDFGPQRPRGAEIILLALMPHGGEAVLNIFVGILPDAKTDTRILVADIVDTHIDAFGPLGIVSMNVVHRRRQLMAHHFVERT